MPKQNQRIKEYNEKLIINTAIELFYENGVEGTTIEDIAKRARMSKISIYNYFPSKSEIALAVLTAAMNDWDDKLLNRVLGDKYDMLTGYEQIERMLCFYLDAIDMAPARLVLYWEYKAYIARLRLPAETRSMYIKYDEKTRQRLNEALTKGLKDNTVTILCDDINDAGELILKLVRGSYYDMFFTGFDGNKDEIDKVRRHLHIVIRQILASIRKSDEKGDSYE